MSPRRIKWRIYWNFVKLTKRWPRKPERIIIKAVASTFEGVLEEAILHPPPDDSYLDGWHLGETPMIVGTALCGCGHGDYRTCQCESQHPSKATGQFDHVEWPEDD